MSVMNLVTSTEFAKICEVAPSRVSHWKRDGLIFGDAIVGRGRAAKIDVEKARAQLRSRRDPGQALGNGGKTKLNEPVLDAETSSDQHVLDRLDYAIQRESILIGQGGKAALDELTAAARKKLSAPEINHLNRLVRDAVEVSQ